MTKELSVQAHEMKEKALTNYYVFGSLNTLNNDQKALLIQEACRYYKLEPIFRPFDIIPTSNGDKLYLNSVGASQLAANMGISRKVIEEKYDPETLIGRITVEVSDGKRTEQQIATMFMGAMKQTGEIVPLKGEALANAMMKLWTKAMRRATLSFIGFSDNDYEAQQPTTPVAPPSQVDAQEKKPLLEHKPLPVEEKKEAAVEAEVVEQEEKVQVEEKPKRGRGRPKKNPEPEENDEKEEEQEIAPDDNFFDVEEKNEVIFIENTLEDKKFAAQIFERYIPNWKATMLSEISAFFGEAIGVIERDSFESEFKKRFMK